MCLGKIYSNNKIFIHCKLIVGIRYGDSNEGVHSISLLYCKATINVSMLRKVSEIILNEFVNVLILNLKKEISNKSLVITIFEKINQHGGN